MGLTGPGGAAGPTGPTGPAGPGPLHVLDANNADVGALWPPNNVVLQVDGTWVQMALSNATTTGFTDCTGCSAFYYFEDSDCGVTSEGPAFLAVKSGALIRDAMVVNDQFEYPKGDITFHTFGSQLVDRQFCFEMVPAYTEGAALGSVPVSSLQLTAPFHLGR